ncbi:MAG: hypothetical protein HOG03_00435 [Desulfobacula sp.]|uniref:trimethylamine methyltransferase family protein n=1 Tax=Desulfobacula sp. TaxID=2593537 RepID=UPI001DA835EE|nr:hypothetical protein [Desulfobacula sp.]MBT3483856.1 hypothetical protein [Desulfobacula sp.]MBT3803044.1 hypothetical protein [Desulfobacula sp.]MBT4023443.1 hypothetical protein [Desulfobacula sp.]MBT4197092.1 hypothetical protein [Desulfobacula sp.]
MKLNTICVLSDNEIHEIHLQSLEILEKIGIHIQEDTALEIFEKAGAKVDWNIKRVFIPQYLTKDALAKANPNLSLYNTDGVRSMTLGGGNQYFATIGYAPFLIDWKTQKVRSVKNTDLKEIIQLADVLDGVDLVHPPGQPIDDPSEKGDLYQAKALLTNTRKPIHTHAYCEKHADKIIAMAAETMGGMDELKKTPHLIFNINTFSPLTMRKDAAEVIRSAAKAGVPYLVTAGCMGGATSPVTLAGELSQANAEILSHIIYSKLINPEAPAIYASWCRIFDMKYSTCTVATPEFALMRLAIAQLARFYNLPSGGGALLSDSNTIDSQYGWEKLMTSFIPALGGLDILFGMGLLSQMNVMSCESLIMDNEIVQIIKRLKSGITIGHDQLAYDIIKEESIKSEYLTNPHTYQNFKNEHFIPKVSDRSMLGTFQNNGSKDVRMRTQNLMEEYMAHYSKPGLPYDIKIKMDEIINA